MIAPDIFVGFRLAKGAMHWVPAHPHDTERTADTATPTRSNLMSWIWIIAREIIPVFPPTGGSVPRMSLAKPASAPESYNLALRTLFIPFTELLGAPSFTLILPAEDGPIVASQHAASRMHGVVTQCQFVAKQPLHGKLRLRCPRQAASPTYAQSLRDHLPVPEPRCFR